MFTELVALSVLPLASWRLPALCYKLSKWTTTLRRRMLQVASMGFSRHEVRDTVVQLMNSGKTVDLNVVLDRLMNRGR